jgi:flagellin
MRGQIGGLAQAQRNAQDGVSLVQTAEGALTEVHSMLQRVRDLRVQYSNETLNTSDRDAIVSEVVALKNEIVAIRNNTEFNGIKLLDGNGSGGTVTFQVGANSGESIDVAVGDLFVSTNSGLAEASGVSDAATFTSLSLADIDNAIKEVSTKRGELGAVQNRLEHRLNSLATYQENLVASESRIRDVDMAAEMVTFTKLNILSQAGTSMLAQANQAPQSVLSLLR